MGDIKSFKNKESANINSLPNYGIMLLHNIEDIFQQNHSFINSHQTYLFSIICDNFTPNFIRDKLIKNHFMYANCNEYENKLITNEHINTQSPSLEIHLPYTKKSSSWCIAISHNNYLSWNAGNGQIFVVPIENFCFQKFESNIKEDLINIKTFEKEHLLTQSILLDCGGIVWSMEFGSFNNSSSKHYKYYNQYSNEFHKIYSMVKNSSATPAKIFQKNCQANEIKHKNGKIQNRFDFTKEDCILATGLANGQIKIWQIPNGRLMLVLSDHKYPVSSLHFSPNPRDFLLLSGSIDRTMKVWDMKQDGNMAPTIDAFEYQSRILCARWYPHLTPQQGSQKIISIGGSNKAYIWKQSSKGFKQSFVLCKILNGHLNEIVDCDFSSDGALLLTASRDSYVLLWDSYSYEALKKFSHMFPPPRPIFASGYNNHGLRGVKFINDIHAFVSVADDGYVRVWDIFSPSENPCRIGLQEYPLCCRFSSRPGIIATGDKFGRLMIWGMCDSHYHMGPQGSKNILCHHRKFFNSTSPDSTSADNTSDTEDSIFKKPYKLQHLCRLAVRTIVPDSTLLEKYFDLLGEHTILPKPLLAYLCYKDIKSQERVVSPNYPYIIN